MPLTLRLLSESHGGSPFPPGRRYTAAGFWQAGPKLPLAAGPGRPAHDLVATGEAAMLGWFPPPGVARVTPLTDTHSLVRLLGGASNATGSTSGKHGAPDGDVVLRDWRGGLITQWELLWSRLDPWVNNSGLAHPILVLDNVPFAFCNPARCSASGSKTPGARYGMDYGPDNVTEYAEWIETLLSAMIARYGESRASDFWFRVGTEPNTRPGHWNDTNQKYVDEYVAVARAVDTVLPKAWVGLANMGADGSHWDDDVTPMAKGIVSRGARVDFIAMSCYGRGTGGRYTIGTAARCSERLKSMRALGGAAWATLPAQAMEYGLQANALNLVDDDPGVFGAAWMLSSSVMHARLGVERAFQWHFGELAFSFDAGACSPQVSSTPCSLYKGTAWVTAMASHLFGGSVSDAMAVNATVLSALAPGSNATAGSAVRGSECVATLERVCPTAGLGQHACAVACGHHQHDLKLAGCTEAEVRAFCAAPAVARPSAVVSADGIGGWSRHEGGEGSIVELRLLLTTFSASMKTSDGESRPVQVTFDLPPEWRSECGSSSRVQMEIRSATLNRVSSPFDAIWRDAFKHGWLTNSSDPNVYPLSKSIRSMLTRDGKAALIKVCLHHAIVNLVVC